MKSIIQIGKGMRLAFTLFAMLALTLTSAAQKPYRYDNGHKYSLWSNLEIGIGGMYSYSLQPTHYKNFGADLRMTKRIGDYWRIRAVAEVNGFLNNGFDRFGKGMLGVSFDLLPFYLFADYGAAFNPSSESKFGLAMDGGIGLQFKVGGGSFYTEAGIDRVNSGMKWQSNASVRLGYLASLGITEQDRQNIDIDRNVREGYGTLKQENQLLKANAQRITQANEQLQATLDRATAALELATERLNNCQTEKKQIAENCGNDPLSQPILFEYASSLLRPDAYETVEDIAEVIKADMSDAMYSINGYCSNNGDPYRNQKLSEERAYTVFMALKLLGVDSSRLFIVGNGMTDKDSARDQKVIVRKAL